MMNEFTIKTEIQRIKEKFVSYSKFIFAGLVFVGLFIFIYSGLKSNISSVGMIVSFITAISLFLLITLLIERIILRSFFRKSYYDNELLELQKSLRTEINSYKLKCNLDYIHNSDDQNEVSIQLTEEEKNQIKSTLHKLLILETKKNELNKEIIMTCIKIKPQKFRLESYSPSKYRIILSMLYTTIEELVLGNYGESKSGTRFVDFMASRSKSSER